LRVCAKARREVAATLRVHAKIYPATPVTLPRRIGLERDMLFAGKLRVHLPRNKNQQNNDTTISPRPLPPLLLLYARVRQDRYGDNNQDKQHTNPVDTGRIPYLM
ncbi:MAG: hypothetical protein LBF09_02735, partial [Odoribacteraceae bacterium]|nr:hypothetical protein [Odoribacteraceae bacterium]